MISVEQAQKFIDSLPLQLTPVSCSLSDALGYVLAEDIQAPFAQPRFHNAAMDGFAVMHQDINAATKENPVSLLIQGEMAAGSSANPKLKPKTCIPIMTGAKVPEGADCVIRVEDTNGFRDGGEVAFYKPGKAGDNIRLIGEEIAKGETLINKGAQVNPTEIGILATFGFDRVKVYQKPKVGIISTGSELVEPGLSLNPGEIYNSNLPLLSAIIKQSGAELAYTKAVRDTKAELHHALFQAISSCDVIITSGGISEGKYDLVKTEFEQLDVNEHFSKVAQKPGMPFYFGTKSNQLFFGLPGNPVSAMINMLVYILPALKQAQGCTEPQKLMQAKLNRPFKCEKKKHRFLFGKIYEENGVLMATPTLKLGSHMLTSARDCNAILESPAREKALETGDWISFRHLYSHNFLG